MLKNRSWGLDKGVMSFYIYLNAYLRAELGLRGQKLFFLGVKRRRSFAKQKLLLGELSFLLTLV